MELALLLRALTGFGDITVLAPLAALMLLWLLFMRSQRGAVWWAIAVILCTGLTAILKVSFYGCPPTPDLHSPSGHTSFSTLVYGAMALVTATETPGLRRVITITGSTGFILGIAASRLLLLFHSAPEVVLGLMIGTSSLAVFGQGYLQSRPIGVRLSPLFLIGGAVTILQYVRALHGGESHVEHLLHALAEFLGIRCS